MAGVENEKTEIVDKPELINDEQVPGIKDMKIGGTISHQW